MRIKWRISIWGIIVAFAIPMTLTALYGEWTHLVALAGMMAAIAHKLVESEEKGG